MSDAATYLSCLLDDGKYAIGQALVQKKKLRPHSFIVGDAYNFSPDPTQSAVAGNVVYNSLGVSQITGSIISKDMFKFSLVIPEAAGPFIVGNIVLYLQSDDGIVFPFIWAVMKIPYPKSAQTAGTIGNRFVFEFIEKIINANDALALTVQPADYYSLAGFTNEFELPPPSQALFQQFVVHESKFSPVPYVGMRRAADNSYWGMVLPFRIGDPLFGVLDGGRAGEYLRPSQSRIYWGGKLRMKPEVLKTNYGGTKTSDGRIIGTPFAGPQQYSIGGDPIPNNPGYTYP